MSYRETNVNKYFPELAGELEDRYANGRQLSKSKIDKAICGELVSCHDHEFQPLQVWTMVF